MTSVFAISTPAIQHFIPRNYLLTARWIFVPGHCIIDAMKITDILRAEHSVFHNLFDHIETTVPRLKSLAEVKAVAVLVDKVMAPHSHTEDELFIDPLEHCFDQIGQRETFHSEHEEIEATLVKVTKARTLKDAKRLLLAVIAAARKHFEKEERIVFPMAERILKAKTLTELGTKWMSRRKSR
jgi:hemerythrin-like domain-containing protein